MKLKVLIFDDDNLLREALSKLVKSRGHEVLSYREPTMCPLYSATDCTCSAEETCGDILLTDNDMPKMTGLEFIHQQSLRHCKGIMKNKAIMSGGWSSEDLQAARSLGCKIFHKPMSLKEIVDWLEECEAAISAERQL